VDSVEKLATVQTLSLPRSLLVANRGEIAIRILRTAAALGIRTVAVYAEDDDRCLHVRKADEARPLQGRGVAAYLDVEQILAVAREAHCDAIHPGYGFLSENADFARRSSEEGIRFVGPRAEVLELLGDKGKARALAERCGVPILPGTTRPTTLAEARDFLGSLGAGATVVLKAIAGGGGRGMRVVTDPTGLEDAYERCRSEAQASFGNGDLYVERYLPRARHVEVQIAGDRLGTVGHLWERDCSLQRRHQKIVELGARRCASG
jgi:pyruvate carboxylase